MLPISTIQCSHTILVPHVAQAAARLHDVTSAAGLVCTGRTEDAVLHPVNYERNDKEEYEHLETKKLHNNRPV
jgi:hypothetical protein